MKKSLLKIMCMFIFVIIISGCGEIPDSLREEEKNYKQMLNEKFKEVEFNILNDKKVDGVFTYEFKENKVDVHIIDAELKDDPTFKFRICTGFSEIPTFTVVYDYATNYQNHLLHKKLVTNLKNSKHITLKSETYHQTHYSKKCDIKYYKETLIFDKNSSVEEIAQELASYSYGKVYESVNFEYGDVKSCFKIYDNCPYEDYVSTINRGIEDFNNGKENYCY